MLASTTELLQLASHLRFGRSLVRMPRITLVLLISSPSENIDYCVCVCACADFQILTARGRGEQPVLKLSVAVLVMSRSAEPMRRAPYSLDLRWRIVWQRLALDLKYQQISKNLCISVGTVHNIFKLFEDTLVGNVPNRVISWMNTIQTILLD